jgi:hypothetical protein
MAPRGCSLRSPAHRKVEATVDSLDSSAHASEATTTDPATRAGDPFAYAGGETPHGCYDGWVYLGFEVAELDENGEYVEEIERVRCRRCTGVL